MGHMHQKLVFKKTKELLVQYPVLVTFSAKWETTLTVDSSEFAKVGIMSWNWKSIICVSHTIGNAGTITNTRPMQW